MRCAFVVKNRFFFGLNSRWVSHMVPDMDVYVRVNDSVVPFFGVNALVLIADLRNKQTNV